MVREIRMTDTQFKAVEEGRMKSNDLETVEITKEYLEYLEDAEKSLEQQRERNNKLAYDKRQKEIELAGAKFLNKVLGELQEEHEGMVQAATLQHLDFFRAKAKFGTEIADLFIEKGKENEKLRKKVDDLWNEILKREEVENGLKAENKDLVKENSELRAEISGIHSLYQEFKELEGMYDVLADEHRELKERIKGHVLNPHTAFLKKAVEESIKDLDKKIIDALKQVKMASGYGVSANPVKSNFTKGVDASVKVAVKNDNSYIAGPYLRLERLVNGKWVDQGYDSPNPLKPDEKKYDEWDMLYFDKGTYRFLVLAEKYDSKGNHVSTMGQFYSNEFKVN